MLSAQELRPEGSVYKIDRLIGEGRTAAVYRAFREDRRGHSKQIVALKILKSKTAVPWLRREFETLARVNSPHCVRVLGWENLDVGCALVLEWIEGVTLLELGRSCELDEKAQAEVVHQVQEGLRALNNLGLHHGDLSPSNILIDQEGCARIVDFASEPPTENEVVGTPAYLAPELWEGGKSSIRSDLFALGLIAQDLAHSFQLIPDSVGHCRRRSTEIASTVGAHSLLDFSPEQRGFFPSKSDVSGKAALAKGVKDLLRRKEFAAVETAVLTYRHPLTLAQKFATYRTSFMLFILLIVSTAATGAQAPLIPESLRIPAQLSLRSQIWLEANLNGKKIGFAPIEMKNLLPGTHRLSWRTARGQGEKLIHLEPGATLRLSENDLLNSARALR